MPLAALLVVASSALTGCEFLHYAPKGESPLQPVTLTEDGAELELVFVAYPFNDPALNGSLWNEIDEQAIPADTRAALAANGIRVGVIGANMPAGLEQKIAEVQKQATPGAASAKISSDPAVRRWQMQIHRDQPGRVVASSVYDQLPLLFHEDGQVRGQTYPLAQGRLVVNVDPQADSRVRVSLTPELEYGEPRQQWIGEDGVLRLQSGKPKKLFDGLKLDVTLAANQTLALTSIADRQGSLGHYFFTEPKPGHLEQKLLLIRLSETKFNDLFVNVTEGR